MTTNAINPSTNPSLLRRLSLHHKLFIASALLSTTILLIAAGVINSLVVKQARQQVQSEVQNLLPVYNAVLEENARSLASIGTTMANSPITKTVFGDPRASRDRETLRQVVADLSSEATSQVDLILISDGAGKITFTDKVSLPLAAIKAAETVAATQQQAHGFILVGKQLFQLVLTPILLQSGNAEYQNTLAVLGTGVELNHVYAKNLQQRMHSEVAFLNATQVFASSFAPPVESELTQLVTQASLLHAEAAKPVEVTVDNELHLAFSRPLENFDQQSIGSVIVFRSLAETGNLFRTIYNILFVLWTLSIAATFVVSYLLAGRVTRPIAALIQSTREVGSGNLDRAVTADAHGELGELANAFEQMRHSLRHTQHELLKRERLAAVGQMAGSIVHDLRNPLATISTAAEMLNRDGLSVDRRQTLIDSQMRASRRMQEMLSEMLDFTRGSYHLELEHHPLHKIAERALQGLGSALIGVMIEQDIPADLFVTVDGERLRRVFENLLSNALQALPKNLPQRKIIVRARIQSPVLRVDIIDNGNGVPEAIRERLFEPFVSYGKLGGTGLGLAIARSIIVAHGGTVGLENSTAAGAHFYFTIPEENTKRAPFTND